MANTMKQKFNLKNIFKSLKHKAKADMEREVSDLTDEFSSESDSEDHSSSAPSKSLSLANVVGVQKDAGGRLEERDLMKLALGERGETIDQLVTGIGGDFTFSHEEANSFLGGDNPFDDPFFVDGFITVAV